MVQSSQTPNLELTAPSIEEVPIIDGSLADEAWVEASFGGGKFVMDLCNLGDVLIIQLKY